MRLTIEPTSASETSVFFCETVRRSIPEDSHLRVSEISSLGR
jgi:hypothetical protein